MPPPTSAGIYGDQPAQRSVETWIDRSIVSGFSASHRWRPDRRTVNHLHRAYQTRRFTLALTNAHPQPTP
jgi:hypothetical protein